MHGRTGTWRRYLEDVADVQQIVQRLGWILTDAERALMDALEEYGRQAPARVREAA